MPKRIQLFIALFFHWSLVGLCLFVLCSCSTDKKPSILLLAIDDLSFQDANCSENNFEEQKSGFHILCQESIRFTHAFTASTLTVPNLTSVLTGLYPLQHQIRHNKDLSLKTNLKTVAEVALKSNYRTSLFSGGAPVFRKTGLQKGFEVFEDNITPSMTKIFRPFERNKDLFLNWLDEIGSSAFFSVIYAPDLIYTSTETKNYLGENRNYTYESQKDELGEQLFELFQKLKNEKRWDNTHIILFGLHGRTEPGRERQVSPLNLHSENIQISLFIKPAQKKRDLGLKWKMDMNVNLVDIGKTLLSFFGEAPSLDSLSDFQVIDLSKYILYSKKIDTLPRTLMIESGWSLKPAEDQIYYAFLHDSFLYFHKDKPQMYNTLTDHQEINPLSEEEKYRIYKSVFDFEKMTSKNRFKTWSSVNKNLYKKYSLGFLNWTQPESRVYLKNKLNQLLDANPDDIDLVHVIASLSLEMSDWANLKKLGRRYKNNVWVYVAEKNLNIPHVESINQPCFNLLQQMDWPYEQIKACNNDQFIQLLQWKQLGLFSDLSENTRHYFERLYVQIHVDQNIFLSYLGTAETWDLNHSISAEPTLFELAINLPEFKKFKQHLDKSLHQVLQKSE
ncbi:MAG: sulfatase-like hydrolase/transferase [Pseudobdellovibrionaceae bacterium]